MRMGASFSNSAEPPEEDSALPEPVAVEIIAPAASKRRRFHASQPLRRDGAPETSGMKSIAAVPRVFAGEIEPRSVIFIEHFRQPDVES